MISCSLASQICHGSRDVQVIVVVKLCGFFCRPLFRSAGNCFVFGAVAVWEGL
jgi:hypothetical protein